MIGLMAGCDTLVVENYWMIPMEFVMWRLKNV